MLGPRPLDRRRALPDSCALATETELLFSKFPLAVLTNPGYAPAPYPVALLSSNRTLASTPRSNRRARSYESSTIADELLMLRYQRGDRAAFESLTRKYAPLLYNVLGRLAGPWYRPSEEVAGHLVKRTLLAAVTKAHGFRHDQHFNTWIYSLAVSVWRDHLASSARASPANDAQTEAVTTLDSEPALTPPCATDATTDDRDWPLAVLTEQERLVFALATLTDLPFDELAEAATLTTSEVSSLVLRASRKISEHSSSRTPPAARTSGSRGSH